MQKVIVIGIGNVLFKDEGVGVYASKYLEKNYSFEPSIEILDGGTLGFKLMSFFQEYDYVFILDTVSIEDKPGSVYCLPSDVLLGLGNYRKTAHEVEIVEMLEICSMLESHAVVTVIGMIPKDIESVQSALTYEVIVEFNTLIEKTLTELSKIGVNAQKKQNTTPLDNIVENFFTEQKNGAIN